MNHDRPERSAKMIAIKLMQHTSMSYAACSCTMHSTKLGTWQTQAWTACPYIDTSKSTCTCSGHNIPQAGQITCNWPKTNSHATASGAAAYPVFLALPSLSFDLKLRSYILSSVKNSEAATSIPILTCGGEGQDMMLMIMVTTSADTSLLQIKIAHTSVRCVKCVMCNTVMSPQSGQQCC